MAPPNCPDWWCDRTLFSFAVPGADPATQAQVGASYQVLCLVIGCHVDYDTLTISGPTSEQFRQAWTQSIPFPASIESGPIQAMLSSAELGAEQLILPGFENYVLRPGAMQSAADNFVVGGTCVAGEFSIIDWTGYPIEGNVPRPTGPFRLLEGEEYGAALTARKNANQALHRANPSWRDFDIHEIQTIKFGGSPTSISNKIPLPPSVHNLYTEWWRQLQRKLMGLR